MRLSLLVLISLLVSGCGLFGGKESQPDAIVLSPHILPHPTPMNMLDVKFSLVTAENVNEFLAENIEENSELTFLALDLDTYESLALNIAEIRRYTLEQKSLIIYYEDVIRANEPREPDPSTDK